MRKALLFVLLLIAGACLNLFHPSGGLSPEGHYYLGREHARVLIEEYSDFQ